RFGVTPRCNAETGRYEKIGSAAGRVARNGKSWWRRFGLSPRCNAGTDETFSRRLCAEMFRLSPDCPERPIRTASLRSHHGGLSRIRADAVASPIFSHVPDEIFSRRICAEIFRLSPYCPERPIRTASLRSHHSALSRIRAEAFAFPIFLHVPDETVPDREPTISDIRVVLWTVPSVPGFATWVAPSICVSTTTRRDRRTSNGSSILTRPSAGR